MAKIAVLSLLQNIDPAYSIATVTLSHIRMLKSQGHEVKLLTSTDSIVTQEEAGCEVLPVLPVWPMKDYRRCERIREEDLIRVVDVYEAIKDNTKDCDTILEHDFLMQGWFYIHGLATLRLPKCNHVIHSRVHASPIEILPDGHKMLVLNEAHVEKTEDYYRAFGRVKAIPNPLDIREYFGFDALTNEFIKTWSLLDYDYIITYALSATRWVAKGLAQIDKFVTEMNKQGHKTAAIYLMAHSQGMEFHFPANVFSNVNFEAHRAGVSRKVVRDFMLLSDGFLFPSISEVSPLTHLEAALAKNTIILNKHLGLESLSKQVDFSADDVVASFLEEAKKNDEFRRVRKGMNEDVIAKRLADWICI